jgi:uncharacterized membrane protein
VNAEHSLEWQFGGWSNLPPWLGWTALLLLAIGGLALLSWFYRHTLQALSWRQRLIFAALRGGFYLSLLFCVAGPTRVERIYDSGQDSRPLAVVVDRSQSMSVADLRGTTRLAHALRVWKKVEPDARHAFSNMRYFRFSTSLAAASDLENAATAIDSAGSETHLYDSLDEALTKAPAGGYGGIVTLTDGLDTTNGTPNELSARALQSHTPLFFAAGLNQQAAPESLLVREISVPGQVLRKTRFTTTVLVEAHTAHDNDVPVSLFVNNQPLAQSNLHLHAGTNLIPWSVPVAAGEPGLLHIDCKLGDGAEQQTLAAAIPVIAQDQIRILFYQGTLDWSFHFINAALRDDPSFMLTGILNPSLNMTQVVSAAGGPTLNQMPDTADKLQPYQVVVLSSVVGDQLTHDQQQAILDYVRGGGGLLFLLSDNAMAQTFSGTDLESVLPVIFESTPRPDNDDTSLSRFQDMMHSIGGANPDREEEFADGALNQPQPSTLQPFALPSDHAPSKIALLFSGGTGAISQKLPEFVSYARVHGIKAGGEVLAVHPTDKTETGEARALLVTQRFGQGQTTALMTDALWRWRLSLPSTSHDPEIFWQQLFLALAPQVAGKQGLRFGVQPFTAALGQTCAFQVDGVHGIAPPGITAISPAGTYQGLIAQAALQDGSWTFQFSPQQPGQWRIRAQDDRGALMETLLRVSTVSHAAELSGLPPDVDGLRKLAESTGGALLNDGTPDTWLTASTPQLASLVSKHSEALWNNWPVLLLGLGLYVTELVWRRFAKLL